MKTNMKVPIGKGVLGRVVNAKGEPIDGKGNLEMQYVPVVRSEQFSASDVDKESRYTGLFEIGIKPFDLLAPVPRNGSVSLIASWGVGKVTLLHELIRTMKMKYKGKAVVVTVAGRSGELEDIMSSYSESGILDSVTVILLEKDSTEEARYQGVMGGLTMVNHWSEDAGEDVMLVVDQLALDTRTVSLVQLWGKHCRTSGLTVISGYTQDDLDPDESPVTIPTDAEVVFSGELSRRGLYPAIDPLKSSSRLFKEDLLSAGHTTIRNEVVDLLRRRVELPKDPASCSMEERQELERAERVERYLTQPFYVAQLLNNIPGEQVSLDETLRSFRAMVKGEYDHLTLDDLSYIGGLNKWDRGIGRG